MDIEHAEAIANKIERRYDQFDEPLRQSIMVVLFGYGDEYTRVECTQGEWSGIKRHAVAIDGGLPHCPNGHPLFEMGERKELQLVDALTEENNNA